MDMNGYGYVYGYAWVWMGMGMNEYGCGLSDGKIH